MLLCWMKQHTPLQQWKSCLPIRTAFDPFYFIGNYSEGWSKSIISCKCCYVRSHIKLKSESACTICVFYTGLLNSYLY
ncbi:hypothetical protein Krac_6364 [Ktedonobacter racemifer DSM 44963]|uniref:Uncharacterized protein n=1 Tax=Ktedonobacter racemifer DSM 44963 TaxID=485913 RepID=D6TYW9_KTERA|nr:hypothetical protein Krac_6364 [Ktedonobacter racemifer DSM 44963]